MKLFTKFDCNPAIRGGVIVIFNIWPNDLERHVTCCARLWDNFHQVWPSTTCPCLNYSVFANALCHFVTLTFDLLTFLQHFRCHAFKLCSLYRIWAKRNNPRLSYWRFSTFSRCQRIAEQFSGVRGPNFTKFCRDIGRSFLQKKFVSAFGFLAVFSNAGGSTLSDVENDAKFLTFWPTVKIRGGWARSLYQLLKLYLRPNLLYTLDGHQLRGRWARCIDRKEKTEKKVH